MERYKDLIEDYLQSLTIPSQPGRLYEPIRYVLAPGGKRLRPVLTLLVAEAYGVTPHTALPAASALEIFHNFTLLHDDIMDHADQRRRRPTVHKKWDENTAILSGDAMVYVAQQQLENYPPKLFKELQTLFNRTALEICEGQQMDMDFEARKEVSMEAYMEMIRKKTAVLLGASLQFGAILAQRNQEEQELLYQAGLYLGWAFQVADDYLDTFGNEEFGKKIGGDIREGKKTFLYIKARECMPENQWKDFVRLYNRPHKTEKEIEEIIQRMNACGLPALTRAYIHHLTGRFMAFIQDSSLPPAYIQQLTALAEKLAGRTR